MGLRSILLLLFILLDSTFCKSLAFQPSVPLRVIRPASFYLSQPIRRQQSKNKASRPSTQLSAVHPAVWWAAGHAIGGSLPVPFVTGAIKEWYRKIDLPSWTPPDRIFAPVWTTLYSCMGVAASKIYYSKTTVNRDLSLLLWAIHYAMNLIWAPTFFGLKRLRLGLWINFGLLGTLSAIIPLYYRIQPISAYLLLPYAVWLTFATFLNADICKKNPTIGGYNNAKMQSDISKLQQEAAKFAGLE